MRIGKFAVAALAGVWLAGAAAAASFSIDSVSGIWTSATPVEATGLSGVGSSHIAWGGGHPDGNYLQTSFDFAGAAGLMPAEDAWFEAGTFTHYNSATASGTYPSSIFDATLKLTFNLTVDGAAKVVERVFDFAVRDTRNSDAVCANGLANGVGVNVNGCADRVRLADNEAVNTSFKVGDTVYHFDISGFGTFAFGAGYYRIWTPENEAKQASIYGRYWSEPAPVPLPAAGWLLLAGVGAMAATRRRRR